MIFPIRRLVGRTFQKFLLPCFPRSRKLQLLYWIHLYFGEAEPELIFLEEILPQKRELAIDVGANLGFYSLAFSKFFREVYAFEPNPYVTNYLKDSKKKNIRLIEKGLSSTSGWSTLFVPFHSKKFLLHGWGSYSKGNLSGCQNHLELKVENETLDSYNLKNVSFIKIDVEGHEIEMLAGATQTIFNNRPTVLIEIKKYNFERVLTLFETLGYQKLEKFTDSIENVIFVPK